MKEKLKELNEICDEIIKLLKNLLTISALIALYLTIIVKLLG